MERKTIGKFISELRRAQGLTQKELGEKLFVSDKTVSRWERDDCEPELSLIPALADVFGITIDELLRGERRIQAVPAPTITKNELSDKQFKLMLHNHKKKFSNLSLLSIGLAIVGVIVASICNLSFSRGSLGFGLGTVFFIASAICQVCFTTNSILLIDEEESERASLLKTANTATVLFSVKFLFGVCLLLAFCLPITLLPYNSHFGLALDSWLGYGLIFTLVAFLLEFCLYKLLIFKLLVQKGLVYIPSERESEFSQNEILFKKVFKTFSIIFLCLMTGLITVSILDDNNVFTKVEQFKTAEEFIERVQTDYDEWYFEGFNSLPDDRFYHATWAELDGKQFYYKESLYYIFNTENLRLITLESYNNAIDTAQTLYICLTISHIINLCACASWYYVKSKNNKTKE